MKNCIVKENESKSAWNKVLLARNISRFRVLDVINWVFDSFIELHGDRGFSDDKSIVGGVAFSQLQSLVSKKGMMSQKWNIVIME